MRKFNCLFLSLVMIFTIQGYVYASPNTSTANENDKTLAVITNLESGEKTVVIPKRICSTTLQQKSNQGEIEKSYEVVIEIPNTEVTTFASDSISKTATKKEVKVTGKFNYTTKYPDKVKVSSCSGSWKPRLQGVYVTNREVVLHGGDGQHMKKRQSKDSFSYNTKWGYKPYVPQSSLSGTGMIMNAVGKVGGMNSKAQIELKISGSDILDNLK